MSLGYTDDMTTTHTITEYHRGYDVGFTDACTEYAHRNADTLQALATETQARIDVATDETFAKGRLDGRLDGIADLLFALGVEL